MDDDSNYSVDSDNESGYSSEQISPEIVHNSNDEYRTNSLETGAKPYASYLGKAQTGQHKITFKTSGTNDYVVIVKKHSNDKYINHIYIKGGDNTYLNVPTGTYDFYFYSGKGWNPNKKAGRFTGGFVEYETMEKDGPKRLEVKETTNDDGDTYLSIQGGEYILYPVSNGNLILQRADINDVLK